MPKAAVNQQFASNLLGGIRAPEIISLNRGAKILGTAYRLSALRTSGMRGREATERLEERIRVGILVRQTTALSSPNGVFPGLGLSAATSRKVALEKRS
jgi:hypothetical protein